MANILAAQTGAWSAGATWTGGTPPGVGDVAVANAKTVTIDQDVTCQAFANNTTGGATAGGGFVVSSLPAPITITLSAGLGDVGGVSRISTADLLTVSATTGTLSIAANITGSVVAKNPLSITGGCTVNVTGNLLGTGGGNGSRAVQVTAPCVLTVTGSVTGGAMNEGLAARQALGIYLTTGSTAASVTVNGNLVNGAGTTCNPAILIEATGITLTVNGDVSTNGTGSTYCGGTVYVTAASCVIDINGSLTANVGVPALSSVDNVIRVKGPLTSGSNGRFPIAVAPKWIVRGASNNFTVTVYDDANYPLAGSQLVATRYVSDSPPPADVRSGTTYGPSHNLTGTCAVPAASSVAAGVPVGATTGTAALTPATVWDYELAAGVAAKARVLANATNDSVGAIVAAAVTA